MAATYGVWPIGWSTNGGCTSGRCVRCWNFRRVKVLRTRCAARRVTCWRRSTRLICSRCHSRPARRRRPRTCSDAILRRPRRRKSLQVQLRLRRRVQQTARKPVGHCVPDNSASSVKYVKHAHAIMYLMFCCFKTYRCTLTCEVCIIVSLIHPYLIIPLR